MGGIGTLQFNAVPDRRFQVLLVGHGIGRTFRPQIGLGARQKLLICH